MSFHFADLFCGIGGFHAALAKHGGMAIFASDVDARARNVYEANWSLHGGTQQVSGDIRPITQEGCAAIPKHQVLSAGFPCQPFSKSGRQMGVRDSRGTLFYDILKVLERRKPHLVMLENVRNLVGPKHRSDYDIMINSLRSLGYAVPSEPTILSPHLLPPHEGGSPQHRERVFMVGLFVGKQRALKLSAMDPYVERQPFADWDPKSWDLREYLRGSVHVSPQEKRDLRISSEVEAALEMWDDFLQHFRNLGAKPVLPSFPMWSDFWSRNARARVPDDTPGWKQVLIEKNIDFYWKNRTFIEKWKRDHRLADFTPSLRKFEWQAGSQGSVWKGLIQARPSGLRIKRADYTPALVAIQQTPILGSEKRELSVSEAAALQGFPKDFDFPHQSRGRSLMQLGNAVHVGCVAFLFGRALAVADELALDWASDLRHDARSK